MRVSVMRCVQYKEWIVILTLIWFVEFKFSQETESCPWSVIISDSWYKPRQYSELWWEQEKIWREKETIFYFFYYF